MVVGALAALIVMVVTCRDNCGLGGLSTRFEALSIIFSFFVVDAVDIVFSVMASGNDRGFRGRQLRFV